jgi:hypothetical protein
MSDLCRLIWHALTGLFRSRAALEAEILVLRHQLNVLRRKSPKRLAFGNIDRLVFAALYRAYPPDLIEAKSNQRCTLTPMPADRAADLSDSNEPYHDRIQPSSASTSGQ